MSSTSCRSTSWAIPLTLVFFGCGARSRPLPGEGPGEVAETRSGACGGLLWPGASVPMAGYCPDHAQRSAHAAPASPRHAWSVDTPATSDAHPVIDDRGRIYALVATDDTGGKRALIALEPDGSLVWDLRLEGFGIGSLVLTLDTEILFVMSASDERKLVYVSPQGRIARQRLLPRVAGGIRGVGRNTTLYFTQSASGEGDRVLATDSEAMLL